MSYFAFVALINTISSAILGWLVFTRNKKSSTNQTFFYYSIVITFWSASYFIWQISHTESQALFWCKALTLGATLIPIFYARFVYNLLGKPENKYILWLFYLISAVFLYLTFGNLLVDRVEPRGGFNFWPVAGKAYGYYLALWFSIVIYSVYLLFTEFLKARGSRKTQLCYILLGTVIGYAGGATNYPLWFNINILPWGNILITFYAIAISYAIVKYKLLNIKIIYTEALVVAIFFGLLIDAIITTNPSQFIIRFIFVIIFSFLALKLIKSITQLEEARTRLEDDKEKLIKLDRMKDEFLMMATHELTTPITAIRGKLAMAVEENMAHLDDEQKIYFTPALDATNRLNHLSQQLLNVTRIDQKELVINTEPISIDDIIKDILVQYQKTASAKNNKLIYNPSYKGKPISIDQKKIKEVISNLIDNAIHFTKDGKITIKTAIDDSNRKLIISISDTGAGIDNTAKKDLFNKFNQSNRFDPNNLQEQQGAGLGLYISKNFVELHGGKMWFESEKDKGSTFYFSLPIKTEEKQTKPAEDFDTSQFTIPS